MKDTVSLAEFPDLLTAQIARSKLESEGITSYLPSEHMASIYPLPETFRLYVKAEDHDRARRILRKAELKLV